MEVLGAIASVGTILGGTQKAFNFLRSIPEIGSDWANLNDEINTVAQLVKAAQNQWPVDGPIHPHTELCYASLNQISRIMDDLKDLSDQTSRLIHTSSSGKRTYKARKGKWMYLRQDITNIHTRLRNAKDNFSMAINLANNLAGRHNHTATTQTLQIIMTGIRAMNTQMTIGQEISQQVQQQTLHAVQSQAIDNGRTRQAWGRKGLTSQRSTFLSEGLETSARQKRIVAARRSGVCLNPWICQRFRTGGFPWPGCDREQCRRIGMSQEASWGLNLPHLLAGYRVSMSISAQLRPQRVMAPFDLRIVIIMSKHPDRGMILPHCHELHPSDVYDNGRSALGCALHHRNFIVLEILISLWENYLHRHGVDRRLFFGANQLLEDSQTTEHEEHILKKLISYMDDDVHVAATPLHRAIEDEDMYAVLEALCAEPSSVNVPNLKGEPPIHLAVRAESESVPMLLALKGAQVDISKRDANERTPLMSAALAGNVEAVVWLMQQQPAAHQDRDIDGNSALHLAAMSEASSSVEVIAKLLEEDAHHSPRNRTRSVPLHRLRLCQADYSICQRKIALLLEAGADIDARDKLERTPLMDALLVQNTAVTRALIDAGAPIDSVDCFGGGALHEVAFRCAAGTLRELSEHETFCRAGVDVLAADSGGHSPWDCFVYSLQVPTEAVSRLGHASEDRCRAFEGFYVQVRDFQIRSDIDALARVRAMLRAKDDDGASRELSALAAHKEPRELWATGVVMQTLRSINLLIRQGDADDAGEALEEQMELLREEQGKSPWAYQSIWWRERPSEIGPSEECWQRQADLARQMRRAGLERWRRTFTEDLETSSGGSDWDTVDEDSP